MRFTDINDGHQKLQENNFWGKSPIDSADSPCVKKVAEVALSRTVLEINMLLRLMQKFKMAAKSGGKAIFEKSLQFTFQVPCMSKILLKSHTVSEINLYIFMSYAEIQDGHHKWWGNLF